MFSGRLSVGPSIICPLTPGYASFPSIMIFTALHGMQTRSYDEISVRLSVKRVHCDKTEERYV